MPLHHIEKWTGRFFDATSLNQEGFVMYLGHGGEPCPTTHTGKGKQEVHSGSSDEEEGKDGGDGVPLAGRTSNVWLLLTPWGYTNSALAGASVRLVWILISSCSEITGFQQAQNGPQLHSLFHSWTTSMLIRWSVRHLPQAFSASFEG
jgi:hypothetical protein